MITEIKTTTVWDSDTLQTKTYCLPIDDALVAAYESDRGNNNTWTYADDPSRRHIREGKYGKALGRFWAGYNEEG